MLISNVHSILQFNIYCELPHQAIFIKILHSFNSAKKDGHLDTIKNILQAIQFGILWRTVSGGWYGNLQSAKGEDMGTRLDANCAWSPTWMMLQILLPTKSSYKQKRNHTISLSGVNQITDHMYKFYVFASLEKNQNISCLEQIQILGGIQPTARNNTCFQKFYQMLNV